MKIVKQKLDDIKRCYCASNIHMNHENHIIFASEDPNIGCEMFYGKDFSQKKTLWKEAGGCMSIIPLPNKENEFLAVQEFYLKVSPSLSKIVWGKFTEEGLIIKDVLHMPYIHRFDVYDKNGTLYFIGATIAANKQNKEDWSIPGRIYVGTLPEDLNEGIQVEVLMDGLYRNHGYWHDKEKNCGFFSSDQGIIRITPPETLQGQWRSEIIMSGQIGEIAVIDIDGDGEEEIMTIEPFHGNAIYIYKKVEGKYQRVYSYDHDIDFAHTLVGGYLRGKPVFLAGVRRMDAELFYVTWEEDHFSTHVLDKGVGPANLYLINEDERDIIAAANHTANEAAIYIVSDEEVA